MTSYLSGDPSGGVLREAGWSWPVMFAVMAIVLTLACMALWPVLRRAETHAEALAAPQAGSRRDRYELASMVRRVERQELARSRHQCAAYWAQVRRRPRLANILAGSSAGGSDLLVLTDGTVLACHPAGSAAVAALAAEIGRGRLPVLDELTPARGHTRVRWGGVPIAIVGRHQRVCLMQDAATIGG